MTPESSGMLALLICHPAFWISIGTSLFQQGSKNWDQSESNGTVKILQGEQARTDALQKNIEDFSPNAKQVDGNKDASSNGKIGFVGRTTTDLAEEIAIIKAAYGQDQFTGTINTIETGEQADTTTNSIPGTFPMSEVDMKALEESALGGLVETTLPIEPYDFGVWDYPVNDRWFWYIVIVLAVRIIKIAPVLNRAVNKIKNWVGVKVKESVKPLCDDVYNAWIHGQGILIHPRIPFVLKFGSNVKLEEARLTQHASKILQKTEVKVPKIYCAIKMGNCRYILMEKVKGDTLQRVWSNLDKDKRQVVIEKLKNAVKHLRASSDQIHKGVHGLDECSLFHATMIKDRPNRNHGSLGPYSNIDEFNQYLCREHSRSSTYIKDPVKGDEFVRKFLSEKWYQDDSTVFSHGDLSPWNIMIDKDGQVSIIDWETAGWWPRYMEIYFSSRYRYKHWSRLGINLEDWIPCDEKELQNILDFFCFFDPTY